MLDNHEKKYEYYLYWVIRKSVVVLRMSEQGNIFGTQNSSRFRVTVSSNTWNKLVLVASTRNISMRGRNGGRGNGLCEG